jgi:Fe2+ transport system protein FeoA
MLASKVDLTSRGPIRYRTCGMQQLTLQQLVVGEQATVTGYARGDRALRDKLLALGLTRGTPVSIVRTAPAGCPFELRARGVSIVLRRSEAAALHVERSGAPR